MTEPKIVENYIMSRKCKICEHSVKSLSQLIVELQQKKKTKSIFG